MNVMSTETTTQSAIRSLRDHYAQMTMARVSRADLLTRLDLLLADESPVPETDEIVHWSHRDRPGHAAAMHDFPEGAPVTRVRQAITCPTCRAELVKRGIR